MKSGALSVHTKFNGIALDWKIANSQTAAATLKILALLIIIMPSPYKLPCFRLMQCAMSPTHSTTIRLSYQMRGLMSSAI